MAYAANLAPESALVQGLSGDPMYDINGTQTRVLAVNAVAKHFFGVRDEAGVRLYARIVHDNPVIDRSNPQDMVAAVSDGRMASYKTAEVGAHLISVPTETLAEITRICTETNAPAALDLLLRRVAPDPGLTFKSVRQYSTDAKAQGLLLKLVVLTKSQIRNAPVGRTKAVLLGGRTL